MCHWSSPSGHCFFNQVIVSRDNVGSVNKSHIVTWDSNNISLCYNNINSRATEGQMVNIYITHPISYHTDSYKVNNVMCFDFVSDTDMRLINGTYKGTVEVFYDGQWGTICDDSIGDDAQAPILICK